MAPASVSRRRRIGNSAVVLRGDGALVGYVVPDGAELPEPGRRRRTAKEG